MRSTRRPRLRVPDEARQEAQGAQAQGLQAQGTEAQGTQVEVKHRLQADRWLGKDSMK